MSSNLDSFFSLSILAKSGHFEPFTLTGTALMVEQDFTRFFTRNAISYGRIKVTKDK